MAHDCEMRRTAKRFGHFYKDRRAATAVEFGIVSILFFPMLVAIFDLALQVLAEQTLTRATQNAARLAQIGDMSLDAGGKSAMRQHLCNSSLGLFDCQDFKFQVDRFDNFAAATVDMIDNDRSRDEDEVEERFDLGAPEEIVVVRIIYDWPVLFNNPFVPSSGGDGRRRLVATSVVRNEPAPDS